MSGKGIVRTGTAGWVYAPWRGEFYPPGLPQKQELAYAGTHLGAIEINATFRALQKPQSFRNWASQTPEDFVFAIKGPQLVTHVRRLRDVATPLANFFASGPLALGRRLGPFVWQLPPNLAYDADRLEDFLALLPSSPEAAADLAGRHEAWMTQAATDAAGVSAIRHAIEVRHESFATPGFIAQLRRHNVALVVADTTQWPTCDVTADFVYCRLQGAPGKDGYDAADLERWAARLAAWAEGRPPADAAVLADSPEPRPRDVFAFFVSTDKLHAPANAMAVARMLAG
ncbi:DUF72 domain-containing protein [Devosia sp.]|uniref:DUF72 domain-containing protein n=1 Tax=Devosia sp. TaxID=1871048 RepID=UPI002F0A75B8